jgi:general secretion pathway protein D
MVGRRLILAIVLIGCSVPLFADHASSAFKKGQAAEAHGDYDTAYTAYKEAANLKPRDPIYLANYTRMRFYAATQHVHKGEVQRDAGKLMEALAEFRQAVEIDTSSFIAQQRLRETADMIRRQENHQTPTRESPLVKLADKAGIPLELEPLSSSPISLRMTAPADAIYKIIGKLAGINVLFDPDYRPPKITLEVTDVTLYDALEMVSLQSKSFWRPTSTNTIAVTADSPTKRKELEENVMKTFYLKNVSTPAELQDAANSVRQILDITKVQLLPAQDALVLRGTTDQMILAQKLLSDIDKPKSEVVIDITVMQISRGRLRTLGTTPPSGASIALAPSGGAGSGGLTLTKLANLTSNDFVVSIPGASFTVLDSDSTAKVLQQPEIRALNDEKATLKIGDRVPIATGSFSPGVGGVSVSPLISTQFQYLDVGVNIDVTPHIHSANDVTLNMTLEISSVTGSQNIGGISQPVIGQRRIQHEMRVKDGEVTLIGGILEETETKSLAGYPWVSKIPILKYLFAQDQKDQRENEIVFAITPHIVRAQDVTEQNDRMVEIGTGSSVRLRHVDVDGGAPGSPNQKPEPAKPAVPQTPAPDQSPDGKSNQRTAPPAGSPGRSAQARPTGLRQ